MAMTSGAGLPQLTDIETQKIRATLSLAKDMLTVYFIDMTEEEKRGRNMAEGREGYARLVSKIATAHENSLARNDNPVTLEQMLNFDSQLETLRQEAMKIMEMISETQLANGIYAMRTVDRFVKTLQAGRDNNAALDLSLREIDEWNKRFAPSTPAVKTATSPEAGA